MSLTYLHPGYVRILLIRRHLLGKLVELVCKGVELGVQVSWLFVSVLDILIQLASSRHAVIFLVRVRYVDLCPVQVLLCLLCLLCLHLLLPIVFLWFIKNHTLS